MNSDNTVVNALVGAVATIFITPFLPFAPVFGGAIAGYLEGGSSGDGLRVGGISGLIAVIPLFIFLLLLGNLFVLFLAAAGVSTPELAGLGITVLVLVFLSVLVYVVALSAFGGWAGAYLQRETDL